MSLRVRQMRSRAASKRRRVRKTKELSRRLALPVAAATLAIAPVAIGETAQAHDYQRQRSLAQRWAPTTGIFSFTKVSDSDSNIKWDLWWKDVVSIPELNGRHRAFEMKAEFRFELADSHNGYDANNFPSGSRPYVDTQLSDSPTDPNRRFGFGLADANYIPASGDGSGYFATVGAVRPYLLPRSFPVTVEMFASTREDDDLPFCSSEPQFCVFNDYGQFAIRGRDLPVRGNDSIVKSWELNHQLFGQELDNPSFEFGFEPWYVREGNYKNVVCDDTGVSSRCYLKLGRGEAEPLVSVSQDVPIRSFGGDNWTVESYVRCPDIYPGSIPCSIELGYTGVGSSPTERRYNGVSIPQDGQWYGCRTNLDHGGTPGFDAYHSSITVQLYNNSGSSYKVDVDRFALALPTERVTSTVGDPTSPPPRGTICHLRGSLN